MEKNDATGCLAWALIIVGIAVCITAFNIAKLFVGAC